MTESNGIRRYDIDWLRIFSMLSIFLFHCARFFNDEDWHVKNNQLDFGMTVFVSVLSQWIMPLFFVLSAISVYYSLKRRDSGQFLSERFQRLMVPLLLGIFVILSPLQVYIERVTHSGYQGSFLDFYPEYFKGFYGFGGNFAWMGLHLWYLLMLFLFSLVTLPFLLRMRRQGSEASLVKLLSLLNGSGVIFGPMGAIFVVETLVNFNPGGIGRRDFGGWSPVTYLLFFWVGFSLVIKIKALETIERFRVLTLTLVVVGTIAGFFVLTSGYSSRGHLFTFIRSIISWSWILTILGFGSRYLKFGNRFLVYANSAVLPFYILHQTVIVTVGFYLANMEIGVYPKYLMLCLSSFIIIIGLYDLGIRRLSVMRYLFGMKARDNG